LGGQEIATKPKAGSIAPSQGPTETSRSSSRASAASLACPTHLIAYLLYQSIVVPSILDGDDLIRSWIGAPIESLFFPSPFPVSQDNRLDGHVMSLAWIFLYFCRYDVPHIQTHAV
jgi:hypothetical protein